MLKYFLLAIAAFVVALTIALGIAPYVRSSFLKARINMMYWWRRQKANWSLSIGRFFLSYYKRLVADWKRKLPTDEGKNAMLTVRDIVPNVDPPLEGQKRRPVHYLELGKLTPVRDANNISLYEFELANKLDDPDVKNIAVTGPYGSGKSSIIQTFFASHPEYKPLFVSLAAFKDDRKMNRKGKELESKDEQTLEQIEEPITPEQQKLLDDRIEFSILQQLFYHVRGKDVPFSRLKRIRTFRASRILRLALLITVYALCFLFVYKPDLLPGYTAWCDHIGYQLNNWLIYSAITGIIAGTMYLVYILFKFQQHTSLIKLNLDKAQLEISPDKGSSVLNQHMDEIVYYFSATHHDLLVIEDLDRFKNPDIFVKLREINTLINNSLQVNKKVTFIYALRDDVFVDESRTKFFDFILPVLPVTNAANSASDMINKFDSLKLAKPVSKGFLNDLALFITDRRLIQNIFNEFCVYQYQLNNPALDNGYLLALIVYKNIYPTDFSDLQVNKGMLYDFFQRKATINAEMVRDTEKQLLEWEAELQHLDNLHIQSVEELKLLYLGAVFKNIYVQESAFNGIVNLGNNAYKFPELLKDEVFEKLRKEDPIYIQNPYTRSFHKTFTEIEKEVNPAETYQQRLDALTSKQAGKVLVLKRQIEITRREIQQIRGQSVTELLIRRKLADIPTPINNAENRALAYLVGNGYISEDYWLYLSYFQPGQLSDMDFQFIMAVKNRIELKPDHKLTHVGQVILRLSDSDCRVPEVLNYDLVAVLLLALSSDAGKMADIVEQLAKLDRPHLEFIDGFRRYKADSWKMLIAAIVKESPHFWVVMRQWLADGIGPYLEAILEKGDIESVVALNAGGLLASDINAYPVLLGEQFELSFDKMTTAFNRLEIKFWLAPTIEKGISKRLLDYVYAHHHYALNREMVEYFIYHGLGGKDIPAFNKGQLTKILAAGDTPLATYLRQNIDAYIKNVFLELPDHSAEEQQTYISLLNEDTLSPEIKNLVIESVSFKIEDVETVSVFHYDMLFKNFRVQATWHNLYCYKKHQGFINDSSEIVIFVGEGQTVHELAADSIDGYTLEIQPSLRLILIDFLQNASLNNDQKITLLNTTSVPLILSSLDHIELPVMKKLFEKGLIALEENTLLEVSIEYFDIYTKLLQKNWSDVAPLLSRMNLEVEGYQQLLSTPGFSVEQITDIYTSMPMDLFMALLLNQFEVRTDILEVFKMSAELLARLAGKLHKETVVAGLIKANENHLTKELVINLLEPLSAPYRKIAAQEGKEVPRSEAMASLLDTLQRANLLVANFELKPSTIVVSYIKEE